MCYGCDVEELGTKHTSTTNHINVAAYYKLLVGALNVENIQMLLLTVKNVCVWNGWSDDGNCVLPKLVILTIK